METHTAFRGFVSIANDYIEVHVATRFGPRVVWCGRPGGANVLAELGDMAIEYGNAEKYHFRGGHRLWVGPELPELSYQPDDQRVEVRQAEDEVTVVSPTDAFGLIKSIKVRLIPGEVAVEVDHVVQATAHATLDVAPWAITQLRPGGVGVLPLGLPGGPLSDYQAAHQITMWPYTDLADPALEIGDREVTVTTEVASPTKIGTSLLRGWLAYVLDDVVFVKSASIAGERFVDLGATGQIYTCPEFLELETVGPIASLANGEWTEHREVWRLHTPPPATAMEIGGALQLDGAV